MVLIINLENISICKRIYKKKIQEFKRIYNLNCKYINFGNFVFRQCSLAIHFLHKYELAVFENP